MSVDDYLGYDIDAPLGNAPSFDKGVSGGLSLRQRTHHAQHRTKFGAEKWNRGERRRELVLGEVEENGELKFASLEVARVFAVGKLWEERPLGYDGAIGKHNDRLEDMMKRCPEYAIALMNKLSDG